MPDDSSSSEVEETKPVEGDVELTSPDANEAAAASTADDNGEKKPETVFEHVKQHLEKEKEAESPAAEKGTQEDAAEAKETKAEDAEGELADAKDDPPPFHEHPRWKEMVQERDGYKATIADLTPKAERFEAMTDMMRDASLSSDEVSAGFNIMALMKGDPVKALEALKPYYTSLQTLIGETIPEDLQEQVETGAITEDAAREMARTRGEAAISRAQTERVEQRVSQTEANRQGDAIATAASEWEQDWSKRDPDYSMKVKLVESEIKAMVADGYVVKTPADAVQLSKDALAAVEATVKPFRPAKPAIKPPPDGSSATVNPVPKNSMEAATAALAAMGS